MDIICIIAWLVIIGLFIAFILFAFSVQGDFRLSFVVLFILAIPFVVIFFTGCETIMSIPFVFVNSDTPTPTPKPIR